MAFSFSWHVLSNNKNTEYHQPYPLNPFGQDELINGIIQTSTVNEPQELCFSLTPHIGPAGSSSSATVQQVVGS